ncbi:hypothetical protein MUK42_10724 [Musa troglodytarum]|uniref:Uncharacterized protein n=1 Tax=Musa troglodytarum TaxID=320322 RepID=A0A9E7FMR1_9LILI|nr:hypothetical protein MUK42_10724 [Musa troglodytarum]
MGDTASWRWTGKAATSDTISRWGGGDGGRRDSFVKLIKKKKTKPPRSSVSGSKAKALATFLFSFPLHSTLLLSALIPLPARLSPYSRASPPFDNQGRESTFVEGNSLIPANLGFAHLVDLEAKVSSFTEEEECDEI